MTFVIYFTFNSERSLFKIPVKAKLAESTILTILKTIFAFFWKPLEILALPFLTGKRVKSN
jgi:hypothetical protein